MICVGIYAVLIQGVSFASDPIASIWGVIGYTVLLCFTLLKTGTLARRSKILFGLTKRQIVCFGTGALIGVPVYFFVRGSGNLSLAALSMIAVMLPFFFFGMYERNGQPPEVVAKQFYQARFVRPKVRPYRTNNYYAALMRQADAQEEVTRIVQKATERQARR